MAMVKILWADSTWYDLTFMKYFWLNQPSPTPIAWYMYQLPMGVQKFLTVLALIGECSIPIMMLFGRNGRIVAFFISLAMSVFIELNGNYGYFNLVTAILGIWCLDDRFFQKRINSSLFYPQSRFKFVRIPTLIFIYSIVCFNLFYVLIQFSSQSNHPINIVNYYFYDSKVQPAKESLSSYIFKIGRLYSRFRFVTPHGVYKYVGRKRFHIKILLKVKGHDWQTVEFIKGKDNSNFQFIAPFMYRIPFKFHYWAVHTDFFMFLNMHTNNAYLGYWITNLIQGILNRNHEVDKLITYKVKGEIEQLRIYRLQLHINDGAKTPFNLNSDKNIIIDSLVVNPTDSLTPITALNLKLTDSKDSLLWK